MFFFSRHGPMTDLATGIKLVFLYSGPSVSITRLNPKLSELSITPDRHIEVITSIQEARNAEASGIFRILAQDPLVFLIDLLVVHLISRSDRSLGLNPSVSVPTEFPKAI